jgi:hypothetical protein
MEWGLHLIGFDLVPFGDSDSISSWVLDAAGSVHHFELAEIFYAKVSLNWKR